MSYQVHYRTRSISKDNAVLDGLCCCCTSRKQNHMRLHCSCGGRKNAVSSILGSLGLRGGCQPGKSIDELHRQGREVAHRAEGQVVPSWMASVVLCTARKQLELYYPEKPRQKKSAPGCRDSSDVTVSQRGESEGKNGQVAMRARTTLRITLHYAYALHVCE
jgi:hypothetical protein